MEQLNLPAERINIAEADWGGLAADHTVGEPKALFPRRDT
jgi:hypothetical protein